MDLRYLATLPMIVGGIVMFLTVRMYRDLLKYIQDDTYEAEHRSSSTESLTLFFLHVFVFGFIVGIADTLIRGVDSVIFFITLIFLLGALFAFFSIKTQQEMAVRLREKTLETMKAFVNAIEMKDSYTKGHSTHVLYLVELLYDSLDPKYKNSVNKLKLLDAALLHDIGKISIDDGVLNKPAKLNNEEWEIIKTHPLNGKRMLEDTCYKEISDWVLYHHERIDGNGYYGLSSDKIPLESKIIAVADTYSALSTDRVYRKGLPYEKCIEIIKESSGTQLDSYLVEKFISIDKKKLNYFPED